MGARAFERSNDPPGFGRQLSAILASGNRVRGLKRLRMPALLIHGSDDPLVRVTAARRMHRLIPDATLWEIPGLGHDMPEAVWEHLSDRIGAFARAPVRDVA